MGEFEEQVRRYWPTGDPLNQASQFLRSEQINVALRLCRMYLVDKVVMDDEQQRRETAYHRAMQEQRQVEQQFAQARDKLDQSEGTIASLRISLWETLHQLEEARALLVKFTAEDAEPILSDVNGYLCLLCETQVDDYEIGHFPHASDCAWLKARAFLAQHKEQNDE